MKKSVNTVVDFLCLKKEKRIVLLVTISMTIGISFGQNKMELSLDSLEYYRLNTSHKLLDSKMLNVVTLPSVFALGGLLAVSDVELVGRGEAYEERQEELPYFRTHADDFIQYLPIACVLGMQASGNYGKNNFGNSAALIIKSELIMMSIVGPLKILTKVKRPDSGARNSFPSGHTAQAFTAATFLHKEYGQISPWFTVGAYSSAASVGVLRVLNNRHWTPDVFVGAAIGILATNLSYATHQYKWYKKDKNLLVSVLPFYDKERGTQVYLNIGF